MFFSNPAADLDFLIFFSLVALAISAVVFIFAKNKFLSLVLFSILLNFVFYGNAGSRLFDIYDLKWIVKFTLGYWPYINIALFAILVADYIKNKK